VRHRREIGSILDLGLGSIVDLGLGVGLGLALAGCGFQVAAGHAGPGDGGPGDDASDGPGSGAGDGSDATTGCWAHWMDGSVAIDASTVKEITELSSAGQDVEPWISSDGLRIYFARDATSLFHGDIYSASRSSPTGTFTGAAPVANLNSPNDEERAWLTSNELAIALSTAHDGPLNIYMITRAAGDPFGTPVSTHMAMVNAKGSARFEPFLTDDLLRLYYTADSGPSNKWQLWLAARPTANDDFDAPSLVVSDNSINYFAPALYQGEQLVLFSSFPNNQTTDMFYATRSAATVPFGTPAKIPTVNTGSNEAEAVLSPDGCELYFTSDRDPGGHFHLFHAQITK
jgi:Tol biopolymer transport system component